MPGALRESRRLAFRMLLPFFLANELSKKEFKARKSSQVSNEIDEVQDGRLPRTRELQEESKSHQPGIERTVVSVYRSAPGAASVVFSDVEVGNTVVVDQQAMRPSLEKTQHDHDDPEHNSSCSDFGNPGGRPLLAGNRIHRRLKSIRHSVDF